MTLLLSSPAQPTSRHRVAAPHSTSSFFQDLDFPIDYNKDFFSQDEKINSQQEQKKGPQKYGVFSGHSGEIVLMFIISKMCAYKVFAYFGNDIWTLTPGPTQQSLNELLLQHGFDLNHLNPEEMERLFTVLQLLQNEPTNNQRKREHPEISLFIEYQYTTSRYTVHTI